MAASVSPQLQHLQLPSTSAPSRTASSSSVRSVATSADDLAEVMRIDSLRAPYDRGSISDRMNRVKLDDARNGTPATSLAESSTDVPNGHTYSPSKSPSIPATFPRDYEKKILPSPSPAPRRFPEEEDEDILRETEERFVLFPIKYREVS